METNSLPADAQRRAIYLAAAQDTEFFCKTFFPKTFRQEFPPFTKQLYAVAEDPKVPYAMALIFRGGSKTTQAKGILAKRLSYGVSRTMMLVSQSQDHSIRTLTWLRKQVEKNTKWAQFYGLKPAMSGSTGRPEKWTDEWICVHNASAGVDIHIVAVGITGQTRGLNIDDFRPDFILGDDIADDQNSMTPAPRQAVIDTWTGAIEKSLAPKSENPFAKILLLQTPISEGDIVDSIKKDPRYKVFEMPILLPAPTPDDPYAVVSAWPARWSTEEILLDKAAHITAGKLRMWMREMMLCFVSGDNQLLKPTWLHWWEELPDRSKGFIVIGVDPTPPPKIGSGQPLDERLDDAAIVVMYFSPKERLVLDKWTKKSPSTTDLMDALFFLVQAWNPFKVGIETILFARTIAEDIIREQAKRQIFFAITPVEDRRQKTIRICTEIGKWCADVETIKTGVVRTIGLRSDMQDIYLQWNQWTGVPTQHDDLLDAISIALMVGEQFVASLGAIDGEWSVVSVDAPMEALSFEDSAP